MPDPFNFWLSLMPSPLAILVATDGFRKDAAKLAEIEEPVFQTALAAVRSASGFLDAGRIHYVLNDAGLEDKEQCQALGSFLVNNRHGLRFGAPEDLAKAIEEGLADEFAPDTLASVVSRFRAIAEEPIAGLERQEKAERMQNATGIRHKSHRLVTDLRPVFDDERQTVEGMYPVTTLTIKTQDDRFEVVLTEKDLSELLRSVETAERKSAVLRELVRGNGLDVPQVGPVTTEDVDAPT